MGRPLYTAPPSTDLLLPWKFSWISMQIRPSGTWRMSRRLTWLLATVEWMLCSVWWTDVRIWCRVPFWSTLHSIWLQLVDTDRLWRSFWTRDLMLTLRYRHHEGHEIHLKSWKFLEGNKEHKSKGWCSNFIELMISKDKVINAIASCRKDFCQWINNTWICLILKYGLF